MQSMLANVVAEISKLELGGAHELLTQMKDVKTAVSDLKLDIQQHASPISRASATPPAVDDAYSLQPSPESMNTLASKLSDLGTEVGARASDQLLLRSLRFNRIGERQANVAISHENTFKWVLEPDSPTNFEYWIRNQSGIYWIMGKAGSGKSTLMKYLINHPDMQSKLEAWAGTNVLVTASYFLWRAGTVMQKSQEGLFRSLLYEILRKCPNMIRPVCACKVENFRPFVEDVDPWTMEELRGAIGELKKHSGVKHRFCFFIDGLDEYAGRPDDLLEVLESIRAWTDIKLCVSSRPWNEFLDAFTCDPYLALQDLTREDIRLYVRDTLEVNPRFGLMRARGSESQILVQEIVDKAHGVFLWVVLVVRSLLTGLRNADRISDLQKRLRHFPETLEEYFRQILDSIEPFYREQTAQSFTYALEAVEPLSLLTYSFLDEENLKIVLASTDNLLTTDKIVIRKDDMQRRLNGRCKGLLEVVRPKKKFANELPILRVDFLHRTVYDFLLTKDIQNMIVEHLAADFDPKMRICKALFAELKFMDRRQMGGFEWQARELLEDLAYYARGLEIEHGDSPTELMDEIGALVSEQADRFSSVTSEAGFLGFLVHRELYLYMKEILTREPLLDTAIRAELLGSILVPNRTKHFERRYDPKMVDLLLENGAGPNDMYKHTTAWIHFLQSVDKKFKEPNPDPNLVQVIKSLLYHGAQLSTSIPSSQKTERKGTVEIDTDPHQILIRALGEKLGEKMANKTLSEISESGGQAGESFLSDFNIDDRSA